VLKTSATAIRPFHAAACGPPASAVVWKYLHGRFHVLPVHHSTAEVLACETCASAAAITAHAMVTSYLILFVLCVVCRSAFHLDSHAVCCCCCCCCCCPVPLAVAHTLLPFGDQYVIVIKLSVRPTAGSRRLARSGGKNTKCPGVIWVGTSDESESGLALKHACTSANPQSTRFMFPGVWCGSLD
jgi:hypothetical protein